MKKMVKHFLDAVLLPVCKIRAFRTFFKYIYYRILKLEEIEKCKLIAPDAIVLSGPFKGLKYPSFSSTGSSLLPKLIGSYEDELQGVLKEIFATEYSIIVDVGCAEGYYAVGLARQMKNTSVYAFDTNEIAQKMCTKMAQKNDVLARMHISGQFSNLSLTEFDFKKHGLIVCDCEGYELELFTNSSVANLTNCDILVEIHDYDNNHIASTILPLFKDTHSIQLIGSNEQKKVSDYPFIKPGCITNVDLIERPVAMQWAFIKAGKAVTY